MANVSSDSRSYLANAVSETPGFSGSALLKILESRACPGCGRWQWKGTFTGIVQWSSWLFLLAILKLAE